MQPSAQDLDLDAVYRAHHAFVWRTVRHLGVDPDRIDDAVQDTFLVVHRRLGEFEGRAALRTWLFEIARRVAGRYRRTAAREAPRRCEVPELTTGERPDEDLARAEAAEILQEFLDELDRDKSVVFIMAELEQRRAPEIAEALALNLNTVYARLRAARQLLDRKIQRLQARERRPHVRRAAEVVAAALLLEIPSAKAWPAVVAAADPQVFELTADLAPPTGLELAAPAKLAAVTIGPGLAGGALCGALAVALAILPTRAPADPDPTPTPAPAIVSADPRPVSSAILEEPPAAPVAAPVTTASASPRAPARDGDALAQELALFEPARAALLAGDARTALRLLDRHHQRFSAGMFAHEAAAARVEALCRLGDRRAAAARREFATRWPDSTLLPFLRGVCDDEAPLSSPP